MTIVSASPRESGAADGSPGEVVEVEVERLPEREGRRVPARRGLLRRVGHGLGPVVAGIVIDVVDFTTFGAVGLVLGFPLGALCGYWLARELGYSVPARLVVALLSGVYCMYPPTTFLPLATLCGVVARILVREPDSGAA